MPQKFDTEYKELTDTELYILHHKLRFSIELYTDDSLNMWMLPNIELLGLMGDFNAILTEMDQRGLAHV